MVPVTSPRDRPLGGWGVLFAALGLLAACDRGGPATPIARPNVVLVTLDTVRADHCSAYGYRRPTTPHLEAIARAGTTFDAAYAPMATTAPSHATMMTGFYPRSHGVVKNGLVLPASIPALAEGLRGLGYETVAFVSSFVLDSKFGLARGFDHYDDDFTGANASFKSPVWEGMTVTGAFDRRADEVTTRTLGWLARRAPGKPLFLWVHYFDPHDPYDPPEPFRSRFAAEASNPDELTREIAAYDGEIAFTDAEMGRLVAALDASLAPRGTLLMVVGDHGEGLMDHGHMHHGLMVFEEAIRVPWVVRFTGQVRAGQRVAPPVELVDLMPTVTSFVDGWTSTRTVQGTSLKATLVNGVSPLDRPAVAERRLYKAQVVDGFRVSGPKHAIRLGPWKYLEAPDEGTRQLFNLGEDPGERRDVAADFPERVRDLAERLEAWRSATTLAVAESPELPGEDEERLRALGYVP